MKLEELKNHIDQLIEESLVAYKAEDYLTAETLSRQALSHVEPLFVQTPLHARCLSMHGSNLTTLGNTDEGLACCYQALQIKQSSQEQGFCYYRLGTALFTLEQFHNAQETLKIALNLYSTPNDQARCLCALGLVVAWSDEHEQAMECYEQAFTLYTTNDDKATCLFNMGVILSSLDKYEQAIERYEQALTLYTTNDDKAECLLNWGNDLLRLNEYEQAIECYEQALTLYTTNDDKATCLFNMGVILSSLDKYEQAIECYEQALTLYTTNDDKAKCLFNMGVILSSLNKYEQAIERYEQAFTLYTTNDDKAKCLFNMGVILSSLNKYEQAIECYEQALTLYTTNDDKAKCLFNWGNDLLRLNKYEQAIECCEQALTLYTTNDDKAECLFNWGNALLRLNEYEQAIECFKQALTLYTTNDDKAKCLFNMGVTLSSLNKYEQAIECYEQALTLYTTNDDKAECLFNMGVTLSSLNKYEQAIECYEQSLTLYTTNDDRAKCLLNWGASLLRLGRPESLGKLLQSLRYWEYIKTNQEAWAKSLLALFHFDSGHLPATFSLPTAVAQFLLTVHATSTVRADFHVLLAQTYLRKKNVPSAEAELEKAAAIYHSSNANGIGWATCLTQLGLLYRQRVPQLPTYRTKAINYFTEATRIVEALHDETPRNLLEANTLFQDYLPAYRELINGLRETEACEAAFTVGERLRARTLIDDMASKTLLLQLQEDPVDSSGVDMKAAYNEAVHELVEAQRDLDQLNWAGSFRDMTVATNLRKRKKVAEDNLHSVKRKLSQHKSVAYATVTSKPLTLPQTQQLLPSDTLLLSYLWQENDLLAWAVRHDSWDSLALPSSDIRKLLNRLVSPRNDETDGSLWERGTDTRSVPDAEKNMSRLSELLLHGTVPGDGSFKGFDPIVWRGVNQVIIVPDGQLHDLPFEALFVSERHHSWWSSKTFNGECLSATAADEQNWRDAEKLAPLCLGELVSVVYAPSATTLKAQKEQREAISKVGGTTQHTYFGVGSSPTVSNTEDDDASNTHSPLRPLRWVEAELRNTVSLFKEGSDYILTSDVDDPLPSVREKLPLYRYIHLAGHGVLNPQDSMGSGMVVFDRDGNSNYLQGRDLIERGLSAEVICWSCCDLAQGKDVTGEGRIGLTRCLLFAGAQYAIVNLREVEDEASGTFIYHFFDILQSQQCSVPEAMRLTRWRMKDQGMGHPADWASFILVGSPIA